MKISTLILIVLVSAAGCERPKTTGNNAFKEYVSHPKQQARDVRDKLEGAQDRAAEEARRAMSDDDPASTSEDE